MTREPDGAADRWTSWLQATPAELVGLAVMLLGALAVAATLWWNAAQRPDEPPSAASSAGGAGTAPDAAVTEPWAVGDEVVGGDAATGGEHAHRDDTPHPGPQEERRSDGLPGAEGPPATVAAEVVVHVSGAVARPGLLTLSAGSRVGDAIDAAGGPTVDADPERLNLARPLQDGEHVHLPRQGEDFPAGWVAGSTSGGGERGEPGGQGGGAGVAADGRIDLNRATAADLETLPNIGPSRAAAIVAHREEHGPFEVPGDLRAVPGIGEKTFQGLAELVTVS